jgi:hypothetical protein
MFHWSDDFYRQNLDVSIVETLAKVKKEKFHLSDAAAMC